MVKLKRLLVPEFWHVAKKRTTWAVVPSAGPHKGMESIPILVLVRDILKLVEIANEAKQICKKGEVLVDGKKVKDYAFPVGLMDSVSIPKSEKYLRIIPTIKGLKILEIPEKETSVKLCKIKNKKVISKNKIQLNLHDGRNILVSKDEYKTGDSLLLEVPSQKIVEHFKLEKGSTGIITKGRNAGKTTVVKNYLVIRGREPNKIVCDLDGKEIEIIKDYFFVVGKNKPAIKISE